MGRNRFIRVAVVLSGISMSALSGCTNVGAKFSSLVGSKTSPNSPAVAIGKTKSDELGRPIPGSTAPLRASEMDSSAPMTSETRAHVAQAMGEMMEGAGELAAAQAYFEQALKLDPKSLKASLALARIYSRLGRPDAALKVYVTAEKENRKSAAVQNDKGLLLAEQKDWKPAIASLRQAIKLEPSNSKYHNNLGMVLAFSGAYDEAYQEFREAIGPGPAHYNLALMLDKSGRSLEARDHLERALVAMPNLKEASVLLSQLRNDSPHGNPATLQSDIEVNLQTTGRDNVTIGEYAPLAETESVQPAVSESPASPDTAAIDRSPWSKRWVAPKWLR